MAILAATHAVAGHAIAAISASVQGIVTNADKAYAAGQYDRASELFEQAWKAAPTETTLLYNAARAAQMAKAWDRAEALYVQYQSQPNLDAKYADKAKLYLPDVRAAREAQKLEEAKAKAKDGEALQREKRYREAAQAYRDAWRLVPANLEYLFRAGAAAALGCDDVVARQYLTDYLAKAAADAADRVEAQARLDGLAKTCKDGKHVSETVLKVTEEHAVRKAVEPDAGGANIAALATLGGGVALLAGGIGLYASTLGDQADYDKMTTPTAGSKVTSASFEEAQAKYDSFHGKQVAGVALAGAGAVVAGVGAWLYLSTPTKVVVAPAPAIGGLSLALRW